MMIELLAGALDTFLEDSGSAGGLAKILSATCRADTVRYEILKDIAGNEIDDLLLELWERKLVIPSRSSKCAEWDARILVMRPGEKYEMPNISRILVKNALRSGNWDSAAAIKDLFQLMGEPDWEKMPGLALELKNGAVHLTLSGARIKAACHYHGLKGKTGSMIAVLKGAGIISPKLMSLSRTLRATSPLYEFNPSVYAEQAR